MSFQKALNLEDLWEGEMKSIELNGKKVLLARVEGEIFAYPDRCLHKALPLSTGKLEGDLLTCAAHGWQYNVKNGCGINPKNIQLKAYSVQIEDQAIWVDIEGASDD